jgi:hypothetical protein
MNIINKLRILAGLEPIKENHNIPYFDHHEYQERLKTKSDEELRHIIQDAHKAIEANPHSPKSRYGYYEDEINYCMNELSRRKKKSSNENNEEKFNFSSNLEKQKTNEELDNSKEKIIDCETDENINNFSVNEEQKEVIELKFDTPNMFTSDDFEKIIKNNINNSNSVYYDYESSKLNKYKTPKNVIKACKDRIREINDSIADDDEKGYNDKSVKLEAIECIEQILKNLSSNDEQGYKQAVIYYSTLASHYLHWLPNQLIKYLTQY